MKIMLSNAPWYQMNEDGTGLLGCRAGSRWPHMRDYHGSMVADHRPFPFFLATASSMLKNDGFDVILRDSIVLGESYDDYYRFIKKEKPDFLMLETATPSIYNDLEIIKKIKDFLPNVMVIVAGLHAPIAEEDFLRQNSLIDYCIYGEYEHPLLLLMRTLRDGRPVDSVPNLVYRMEDGTVCKTDRETLVPMKELPWPDRDSLPATYYDGCCGMPGLELQIHTSRGCPYRCNFCVWPQLMYAGPAYRMREPQDVVNEILANFEKVSYTHFYIDDDTVNLNKKHFMELCRLIKETGLNKYPWGCMGRGDIMDDEMLNAMKEAGCYGIKYGVESFNQEIINRTGKALNIEKNVANIKKTEESGIKVHLTYCLGLMGDTKETVEDTVRKSLELPADSRQYSIATPYLGSRLWQEYKEKGLLVTEDLSKFDGNHTAVAYHVDLPAEELMRIRDEAERLSDLQISNMPPTPFKTVQFAHLIQEALSGGEKFLLLGASRRSVVKKIAALIMKEHKDVDVLTHERFLREYDGIPRDHVITFCEPMNFCKDDMDELINKCKNANYDAAIVPSRMFTRVGMENVIEVAQMICNKVVMVYEDAKIEIL